MKVFYSAYLLDYKADTDQRIINFKKKEHYKVEVLMFERLKQYSIGKIFKENDNMHNWINKIQARRNIIHAFKDKELGEAEDFIKDIDVFCEFVLSVNGKIPHSDHRNIR